MNVLVVGSGAREHALVWKLSQSDGVTAVHAVPGTAGIGDLATCHPDIDACNIDAVVDLATSLDVGLVVVGSEAALVAGLGNRLRRHEIPCVAPSAAGARIEGSKVYAKELMDRAQVPTARWEAFSDVQAALAAINRWRGPVVIKADGLTAGRGTFVCMTKIQAERALTRLLVDSEFGVSGRRVVVEELLHGVEASVSVITDGETIVPLPVMRCERRRDEGGTGLNTEGMGAYCPVDELFETQVEEAIDTCIRPALQDLRSRGAAFCGVLYADIMFTKTGPKVLEYNCRLGQVEATALVRNDDLDLFDLLNRTATGALDGYEFPVPAHAVVSMTVVDESYPKAEKIETPVAIAGLVDATDRDGVEVFYGDAVAGSGGALMNAGGQVLTVTAVGESVADAAACAAAAADDLVFEGRHFRADVAAHAGSFV